MLDFTRIIAGVAGQRETFEELVCQIARRSPPQPDAEFRRIYGAGGDGGVEAVWVLKSGDEIGYQAKFYTSSAGIDWAAINSSVKTALTTHRSLTVMHIAIACSLTGPTNRKTKAGQPTANGWSEWEKWKAKWVDEASASGRSIDFIPWTAPDLEELLGRPSMVGLTDYWFGGIELTPKRLATECRRTVDALEERYHPEDHVDVSTRSVFDGLLHNDELQQSIAEARAKIIRARQLGPRPANLGRPESKRLEEVDEAVAQLVDGMAKPPGASEASAYEAWETVALALRKLLFEAIQSARDLSRNQKAELTDQTDALPIEERNDGATLDSHIYSLRKLQSAVGDLLDTIASNTCRADATRFVLLDGRAGSGKSHLMASEVERALASGAPALFLIGSDFTVYGTPENQLLAHLECSHVSFDRLLGALSARAEATGKRGLVAIDALNEGAGAALWRNTLQGFARRLLAFPNLSLCVSCRHEYLDHLIAPKVAQSATTVEIVGFETPADIERAAKVYMDRRGIVRPATPWLNPEFSNPLFLRTTCLALQADGRTSFPRGMRGTSEVLNFYLTSTGRHLGTDYDGSDTLVGPLRSAILALAKSMAVARRDSLAQGDAHRIVEEAFVGFPAPAGKTWLETLRFRGLLRHDPDPDVDLSDPLATRLNVVRFAFQRFSDHLIARALLEGVDSPTGLFDPDGPLAFLLESSGVDYDWRGLFYALVLNFADRYSVELVDCLPGGFNVWWGRWPVEDAFVDSIRWREPRAFSHRTLELLNRLNLSQEEITSILVELAVVEDHPWNIELLHRNLTSRSLAERDAFWTVAINAAHDDPGHPLVRLVDWCLNAGASQASDKTLDLALVTLAWSCTSTSALIRDTASKAIIAILVTRPSRADKLFARFSGCDDLYVVERLYAALYGSALRTVEPGTLAIFASIAWTHFFKATPPVHLLARDYARGTVDLAASMNACDPDIDLARCYPPYGSNAPRFVAQACVDARGAQLGASEILRSCYKGLADFGRYTVEGRVHCFADARLNGPRPTTLDERGQAFFNDVTAGRIDVEAAFSELRAAHADKRMSFDYDTFEVSIPAEDLRRIEMAESVLFDILTPAQRRRYDTEARAWVSENRGHEWTVPGKGKGKAFDAHKCKVWIANRAISLGWTAKRFPEDRYVAGRRRAGGRVERIGKKYQRIALMELLARLADNYWLKPEWGNAAKIYENPLDVEFTRDIEPSLLPTDQESQTRLSPPRVPPLVCEPLPIERRRDWVMHADLADERLALAACSDLDDMDWMSLYRYAGHNIEADPDNRDPDAPWLQSDFHYLAAMLVPSDSRDRLVNDAITHAFDFHDWLPPQIVDGPYIGELARRDTWRDDPWSTLTAREGDKTFTYQVIRPTTDFLWESHLDNSLPNGFSRHFPIPWLIRRLSLLADTSNVGVYLDATGAPVIVSGGAASGARERHVLIRRDAFLALAEEERLEPVWTVIGERCAATLVGESRLGTRVRYNGISWLEKGENKRAHWSSIDGTAP